MACKTLRRRKKQKIIKKEKRKIEKLIAKITALGVPGPVLPVAVNATGLAGGAAVVTALAALGPGGIIGGIACLGLIGMIAHGLTEYGMGAVSSTVVKELLEKGETKASAT